MRVASLMIVLVAGLSGLGRAVAVLDAASRSAFRLLDDGGIVVAIGINGVGPFHVLLDTGQSRTVIATHVAESLGLTPVAQTLIVSPIGRAVRPVVRLDSTQLASTLVDGLLVGVSPREHLGASAMLDGILGQDLLSSLHYTLDYRAKRFTLHEDGAAGGKEARGPKFVLEPDHGRFLVTLLQNGSLAPSLRLVPDTGATSILLIEGRGRTLPPYEPLDGITVLATMTGHRSVRPVLLRELQVGSIMLRNRIASIVPRHEGDPSAADGLLPMHFFARATFNGPARYLVLESR